MLSIVITVIIEICWSLNNASACETEMQEIRDQRRQAELMKKREDEMLERVRVWKTDILPHWAKTYDDIYQYAYI